VSATFPILRMNLFSESHSYTIFTSFSFVDDYLSNCEFCPALEVTHEHGHVARANKCFHTRHNKLIPTAARQTLSQLPLFPEPSVVIQLEQLGDWRYYTFCGWSPRKRSHWMPTLPPLVGQLLNIEARIRSAARSHALEGTPTSIIAAMN
jgi:hypothetical protein